MRSRRTHFFRAAEAGRARSGGCSVLLWRTGLGLRFRVQSFAFKMWLFWECGFFQVSGIVEPCEIGPLIVETDPDKNGVEGQKPQSLMPLKRFLDIW